MQLDGRLALITGAGSGIGRALAIAAAREGMDLVLVGRRQAALDETRARLPDSVRVQVVQADITGAADRARLVAILRQSFGRLDLLVHNAGTQWAGRLGDMEDGALEAMLRTNVQAPIALTRDLMPCLAAAAPSRVVFVGSMFGDIAFPLFGAYSASKAAIRGFAEALRREVAEAGVGVTYVAPRGTRTAMAASAARLIDAFAMKLDPPEAVAGWVIAGLKRDADTIYPPGIERLFVLVQRLLPSLIDRALARQLAAATRLLHRRPRERSPLPDEARKGVQP